MSKLADFVLDFLAIVSENPKYKDKGWDWDNLPAFETMWEIVEKDRVEKE